MLSEEGEGLGRRTETTESTLELLHLKSCNPQIIKYPRTELTTKPLQKYLCYQQEPKRLRLSTPVYMFVSYVYSRS